MINAVFLDLKRAFETISRSLLLLTLLCMNLREIIFKCFESFLDDIIYKIVHGDFVS